jgi:hypothetical protein
MRLLLAALGFTLSCTAAPSAAPPEPQAPVAVDAAPATTIAAASSAPDALVRVAADYGMIVVAEGWTWTETERMKTRFDWSGLPPGGAHEVRWSFWVKGDDMKTMAPFLPQVVQSAAMNLTREPACEPFEQPPEVAQLLGADRIVTVCFTPADYVTTEQRFGVLHGLVRGDVLVIVIVLANDRTGTIPLADVIGARFAPR